MSPRRRLAVSLAAAATAALSTLAGAPASPAAAGPTTFMQMSEPEALWMPSPTKVTRLAPAALVSTTSTQYKFSSLLDGQPVRWDPCTVIHWRSNTSRGPAGGLDVLKAAVNSIALQTGTRWVYDGATTAVPSTAYLPKTPTTKRPVLLGWTDGTASDLLRGKPAGVLGMTRTVWFGTDDGQGHRVAATRAAVVALDRTDRLPLRGNLSWTATVLHELGHVMGLDHPVDRRQLMAATLPATVSSMQTGDRTGLGRLGRAAGCVNVPGY